MTVAAHLRSTLLPLALLCSAAAVAQTPPVEGDAPAGGRQPGARGPGGPMAEERKILERFDADGNGRLEGAERDAARAELKKAPQRGGRGGMRGPGGPGGPRAETKPGPKVSPKDVRSFPDAPLFDPGVVRTVFLEFDVANWEEELELFHNTDADVPARMTVDGKTYEGVGVHFRGASSYMMVPRGAKRSFNIAVDHTDPKAALHGQNTLNLLNSNADASMMSSVLYAHLARPHLPAPRANFVHVVVNGESWGVYVNVEQFNKAFLRERWPEFKGEGARWKVKGSPNGTGGLDYRGEDLEPYRQRYEIKTKDSKKDWEALVALCRTLSETPIDGLEAALKPMLDIDGALWFLALDAATANTDGYWVRASDYSLYRDPKGVFHLVPHDMNEAFKLVQGGPGGMRPGGPPPDVGPDGPPPGFGPDDGPREDRPRFGRPQSAPGAVAGPQDDPPMPEDRPRGARPGRGAGGRSLVELDPFVAADDATKPLRSRLLRVPALREKYEANIRLIAEEMRWERLGPVVARNRALIADLVAADTRKSSSTEAFERATAPEGPGGLREFLDRRSQYLLGERPKTAAEDPKDGPKPQTPR